MHSSFFLILIGLLLPVWAATPVFPLAQDKGPYAWKPGTPLPTVEPDPNVYWKVKPKAYNKISRHRAILVSVKEIKPKNKAKKKLIMVGGAHYNVPFEYAFKEVTRFSNLPKMSSFVQEAKYDSKSHQLYFHCKAFKYHARMVMQVEKRKTDSSAQMRFRVINSGFRGLTGVIEFTPVSAKKSEVSLNIEFKYFKLPLPSFFVEFGLEVALQKMAGRIRSFLEEKHHG